MAAFLNSGDILRPILSKSQCWCVDGATKFVLRVSQNQYYRIELPGASEEDNAKAAELKRVLATVLRYETTPCPFQRSFTVELPEPPRTPVRRRPWKPFTRVGKSEDATTPEVEQESADEYLTADSCNSSLSGTDDEIEKDAATKEGDTSSRDTAKGCDPTKSTKASTRPKSLATGRAVTAPIQLSIKGDSPPRFNSSLSVAKPVPSEASEKSTSLDSFRSFHSPISPLPPSPPYSNPPSPLLNLPGHIELPRRRPHTRDISEATVTVDSPDRWHAIETPTRRSKGASSARLPEKPMIGHDTDSQTDEIWSEAMESPTSVALRYRPASSRRRAYSPLPMTANLFSPTSRASRHYLTTAMLQKTCSILLGPPVQLIALMLNIAKKIADGATRGIAFGFGEAGETITCQWDYRDEDGTEVGIWNEDNHDITLDKLPPQPRHRPPMSGSWEID